MVSFLCKSFDVSPKVPFVYFSFISISLGDRSKNITVIYVSFLSLFSPKSFMISVLNIFVFNLFLIYFCIGHDEMF